MEKVDESFRQEHSYIVTSEYMDASGAGVIIPVQNGEIIAQVIRQGILQRTGNTYRHYWLLRNSVHSGTIRGLGLKCITITRV